MTSNLLRETAELAYLMLPVYAANMAAPFARFWPWRNPAIAERQLGAHKTWVGVALAVAAAEAVACAMAAANRLPVPAPGDWPAYGASLGIAAMAGDAAKSWIKRRRGIAPGARWLPFDQLDFLVAGALVLRLWWSYRLLPYALMLVASVAADLLVNRAAFRLGIRRSPW